MQARRLTLLATLACVALYCAGAKGLAEGVAASWLYAHGEALLHHGVRAADVVQAHTIRLVTRLVLSPFTEPVLTLASLLIAARFSHAGSMLNKIGRVLSALGRTRIVAAVMGASLVAETRPCLTKGYHLDAPWRACGLSLAPTPV
jgi:hypothetical protein